LFPQLRYSDLISATYTGFRELISYFLTRPHTFRVIATFPSIFSRIFALIDLDFPKNVKVIG